MSDPFKKVMAEKTLGTSPDELFSQQALTSLNPALKTGMNPADLNTEQIADEIRPSGVADAPKMPVDEATKSLAMAIAHAADDRKGGNITILQTGDISYLADYFVIVTGFSNVQVRAIANAIASDIEEKFGRLPLRTEGMSEGRWVLQDYGEVIVHVFMPDDREFYDLEAFWGHAERIEFTPDPLPAAPLNRQHGGY